MSWLVTAFSVACVAAGCVFFCAGTVGLLRFPDPLSRLHALSKADNLGLGLVALGLLPHLEAGQMLKFAGVWLLAQLSAATVSQLVAARAARREDRP